MPDCFRGASISHPYRSEVPRSCQSHNDQFHSVPMYCVVNNNNYLLGKSAGLVESIEQRVNHFPKEQQAIAYTHYYLRQVAVSFESPLIKQDTKKTQTEHARQRRLIPALMAAAGATSFLLRNSIKDAAWKPLSVFKL